MTQQKNEDKILHIRRELLGYLQNCPRLINQNGGAAIADVSISVGNFLLWMHSTIEIGCPPVEQPIDEIPQTVFALGKQFRQVGVKYWDRRAEQFTVSERQRIFELEFSITQLAKSMRKGGAK